MTKKEQLEFIEITLANIKRHILKKLENDPDSELTHLELRKLIHSEASQYDYLSNEPSLVVAKKPTLKEYKSPARKRVEELIKYQSMIGTYGEEPRH